MFLSFCYIYKDFVRQLKAFPPSFCHFCAFEMSPGWGHLITWMDPGVGHLNDILAQVGGNLNNNFQKSQMPGGLPGGGGACWSFDLTDTLHWSGLMSESQQGPEIWDVISRKLCTFRNSVYWLVSFAAVIRVVTRHDPNNGCEGDYIDRTHWKGFEESSENFRDYSALPKLLS